MVGAGKLRRHLLFEQLTETQDSDANLIESWVDAFDVNPRMPCEVVPLNGRELLAAAAVQSRAIVKITCRYRAGFSVKMRATDEFGSVYNLESMLQDSHSGKRWIIFTASTGANAGGTAT